MKTTQFHLTVAGAAALLVATAAAAGDLRVVVTNASPGKGVVRAALYDSQSAFLVTAKQTAAADAGRDAVELVFKDIPKGWYAVSVYQDANGNQKLDSNSYGIPIEPYGMSRNAKGQSGPPSFDDAKVEVGPAQASISIGLHN